MPRRSGNTAADIIQVASHLFADQGFSGTGVAEISKSLGITNAALYYHFESKQALLLAIITDAFSGHLERLEAIVADDCGPTEKLRRALDNYLDLIFGQPETIRVFLRERRFLDPEVAAGFQEGWKRYDELFDHLVADHLAALAINDLNPRLMRLAIQGMLSTITEWYVPGGDQSEQEIRDELLGAVMGRLLTANPGQRRRRRPAPAGGAGPQS